MPIDSATFDIKRQLLLSPPLYLETCVLHYHYMDWCEVICWYLKYAINPCKQRFIVCRLDMLNICIEHFQHFFYFLRAHRFNQKPLIMRKEEETATRASTLTSLKHHSPIERQTQRFLNHTLLDSIELNHFLELILGVTSNLRLHFQF